MKIRNVVIVTLAIAAALYWYAHQEPVPYSDLHPEVDSATVAPHEQAQPLPPPQIAQPSAEKTLRPREVVPNAVPMKIHWNLKLPNGSDLTRGTFVFRNAEAFNSYLGSKNQCFARWSNVDFKRQMAVVMVTTGDAAPWYTIDSVVRNSSEIVVYVKHTIHTAGPAVLGVFADGIAINRSDLPVRFSEFDEAGQ